MDQTLLPSQKQVLLAFAASCVEYVARAMSLPYHDVYQRMKSLNLFNKLIFPHYETLHSESREVLTQRIIEYLKRE